MQRQVCSVGSVAGQSSDWSSTFWRLAAGCWLKIRAFQIFPRRVGPRSKDRILTMAESHRAAKMMKSLGIRPPTGMPARQLPTFVQPHQQSELAGPSRPNTEEEQDYVLSWVRAQNERLSKDPPNNRKRKLIPQGSSVIRAEISSPNGTCVLTINSGSKGANSPSTTVVSVDINRRNVGNAVKAVDPKVIRDLFAALDTLLAQRQEEEAADISDDDQLDANYEPSNKNSSDSRSEASFAEEQHSEHPNSVASSGHADDPWEMGSNLGEAEEPGSPPRKKRMKRRVRQTHSSSRRERQTARNSGKAYTTSSGKKVSEKKSQPLPENCRKKCSSKLSPELCSELCRDFWNLGKLELRNGYMVNLIEVTLKSSQRLNPSVTPSRRKNRQYTMKYHVVKNGENVDVCKGCFTKVFNISSKYIEGLMKQKMSSTAGTLSSDKRGQSSNPVAEERLASVIDHLNSFPKYVSHYARNKTDKHFLNSNLTMKSMYEAYREKYPEKPVSRWIYEREFHNLNLSIKPLRADTCNKCDTLQTAVLYAKNEEAKTRAKMVQELHHRKAEKARTQKEVDVESLKTNPQKVVLAFDLQQCLPTPHLQTSVVFYRRHLWVYNLTVHDCGSGKSCHNMWHEGEGERGPNEVGSALYKYLMDLPDEVQEVVMWSDTCGGQNKNSIICAVLQTVLQNKKTLKTIDQKFLVSGHTFMDCDTDHAAIEGKKRKAQGIHLPRDWYSLVRNASKNFSVQVMDQSLQLNFKGLLKGRDSPLVKRKKNNDKEKFVWKDVVWLRHSRALPAGTVAYKATHEEGAPFQELDLKRKKKERLQLKPTLTYDGPRAIKQKKKNDLLELLHLIDPECRPFYLALRGDDESDDEPEIDPDLLPTSDEEESGEE